MHERGAALKAVLIYIKNLMENNFCTGNDITIVATLSHVHSEEIKAVHPKAQESVPIPAGLALHSWIDADESEAEKIAQRFVSDQVKFCAAESARTSIIVTSENNPEQRKDANDKEIEMFNKNEWSFLDTKGGGHGFQTLTVSFTWSPFASSYCRLYIVVIRFHWCIYGSPSYKHLLAK